MAWFFVLVVVFDDGLLRWFLVAVTCWIVDCSLVGGWARVGIMQF